MATVFLWDPRVLVGYRFFIFFSVIMVASLVAPDSVLSFT